MGGLFEMVTCIRDGPAPGGGPVIIACLPKPPSERPWNPPPEQQVSKDQMNADMVAAGLKVVKSFGFLPEPYFVVYEPAVR